MNDILQEINNAKVNIYEAYDEGVITESEKDNLLLIVEEALSDEDKEKIKEEKAKETKKKIKKALTAISLTIILLSIISVLQEKNNEINSKIKTNHNNYNEIRKISDHMTDIRSELKALEKKIPMSPGRTLTDEGRENVEKYIKDLKDSYKDASNLFRGMHPDVKDRDAREKFQKASTIMSEIAQIFNSI